jgi:putative spermidine/putrescine transport system permease protein
MSLLKKWVPSGAPQPLVLALLVPSFLAIAVTFIVPLIWLLHMSFYGDASMQTQSVSNYVSVIKDAFYWKIIFNTLWLGVLVSALTVLTSYPVAFFLARTQSRWRGLLAALAIAPLLTSTVVRTYGWMVILGNQGLVNSTLMGLGLIDTPLPISNNFSASCVALVEIMMPYAILTILSGLGRLSIDLESAAASLGANKLKVFLRIILPLSVPAIATAALLVFVLAISSFVTPRLIGGGRVFVLATEIYSEATVTLNWPLAATLSVLLLVLFGGVISLYQKIIASYS